MLLQHNKIRSPEKALFIVMTKAPASPQNKFYRKRSLSTVFNLHKASGGLSVM
jgi:uncharacterized protein (UPF0303 family)